MIRSQDDRPSEHSGETRAERRSEYIFIGLTVCVVGFYAVLLLSGWL